MNRGKRTLKLDTKRPSPRVERVSTELKRVIADSLERRFDGDGKTIATVTAVDVDPDLRHARIYFDRLDDVLTKWLTKNRHHLQGDIASRMRIRSTPRLEFAQDPAISSGIMIESILRDISSREIQDPQ